MREEVADVLQQHVLIHTLSPLLRCVYDGRKWCTAAAASDHVVARGIGGGGGGLDVRRLAWQEERVAVDVPLTFVSLIEEEDVLDADALELASHLGDFFTGVGRHWNDADREATSISVGTRNTHSHFLSGVSYGSLSSAVLFFPLLCLAASSSCPMRRTV